MLSLVFVPQAVAAAAAIVAFRGKGAPFQSIDDLKKVPGLDFAMISAVEGRIAFPEF